MELTAFYHPGFAAPLGEHQMPIRKFGLVAEAVGEFDWVKIEQPKPVKTADLERVHTRGYIEAVRTGEPRALAEMQKFPWTPELFPSVCLTAGGCHAAASRALRKGASMAIASGFHHACADHGEGFCTFNGLVIATDALVAAREARRVAILDMDLHYGNGTAQLAVSRPYLFALSIYGNDYCNNVPYRDVRVRRHEDGENHRSIALPAGCDGATLQSILDGALPTLAAFRPDLVIYQAGADPYREDPYSPLALTQDDLRARDLRVFRWAKEAKIPISWVLAGGYTEEIRKIVKIHVNTFHAWREAWGD